MKTDRINEEMQKLVDMQEMAGGALIVRHHGKEVYKGKWGYADIQGKKPVDYNTMWLLCSMSKPITAAAVMLLIEQGKMGLDDKISQYIPGFKHMRVCAKRVGVDGSYQPDPHHPEGMTIPEILDGMEYVDAKREITVRDLLTHSSGLGMEAPGLTFMERVNSHEDVLATRIAKWTNCPLDFQPGEGTGYSPYASMEILGHIAELISGYDYQTFLKKHIFEPLGIRDITFQLSEDQHERLACLYKGENGKLEYVPEKDNGLWGTDLEAGYFSGAAGMTGSIEDYDKITTMFAQGGIYNGTRLLKEETVRMIYEERGERALDLVPGVRWGLGMAVFYQPSAIGIHVPEGTYGWSGAYGTHMFIHPDSGISATFAMNRADIGGATSPIARKVEEVVFDRFLG